MSNSMNNSRIQNFEAWSQDKNNNANMNKGLQTTNFKMFEVNETTYLSDIYNFAQEYISEYDNDGNGIWSESEYLNANAALKGQKPIQTIFEHKEYAELIDNYKELMTSKDSNKDGSWNETEFVYAYTGKSISKLSGEEKKQMEELFKIYNHINSDDNKEQISAEELAYTVYYPLDKNLQQKKEAYDSIETAKRTFRNMDLDGDKSSITAAELASDFIIADLSSSNKLDGELDFTTYREISTNPEEYIEARSKYHKIFNIE